jgi:hypothetical protein
MIVRIFSLAASFGLALSAALAQEPPPAAGDPTVIGQVEHLGYGLIGPRGRHYVFGGIAMADYSDSAGTRRIVTLQLEDQASDDKYIVYHELREGHRWAFSRKAAADGTFGVWIQLAASDPAAKPQWQSFQRARLATPKDAPQPAWTTTPSGQAAPLACCGH